MTDKLYFLSLAYTSPFMKGFDLYNKVPCLPSPVEPIGYSPDKTLEINCDQYKLPITSFMNNL
jgi:hypothetical protein